MVRGAVEQPADGHLVRGCGLGAKRRGRAASLRIVRDGQHHPLRPVVDRVQRPLRDLRGVHVVRNAHDQQRDRDRQEPSPPARDRVGGDRHCGQQHRGDERDIPRLPGIGRARVAPTARGTEREEHDGAREQRDRHDQPGEIAGLAAVPHRYRESADQHDGDEHAEPGGRTQRAERLPEALPHERHDVAG